MGGTKEVLKRTDTGLRGPRARESQRGLIQGPEGEGVLKRTDTEPEGEGPEGEGPRGEEPEDESPGTEIKRSP